MHSTWRDWWGSTVQWSWILKLSQWWGRCWRETTPAWGSLAVRWSNFCWGEGSLKHEKENLRVLTKQRNKFVVRALSLNFPAKKEQKPLVFQGVGGGSVETFFSSFVLFQFSFRSFVFTLTWFVLTKGWRSCGRGYWGVPCWRALQRSCTFSWRNCWHRCCRHPGSSSSRSRSGHNFEETKPKSFRVKVCSVLGPVIIIKGI